MRTSSFRSLLLAAVLPMGLAACGPEIDENILKTCDARAPRGSAAHDQCVSDFESGAEVLPQLVIRDEQLVIRDSAQPLVIRDTVQPVVIRDTVQPLVIRD